MCTLVWQEESGKQWLCFNRDEQRSRPPAEPMQLHAGPNGPVAYARDPQGGGTWFAVSSNGFAVALLNHYLHQEAPEPARYRSRGLMVKELAECASVGEAAELADRGEFAQYRPFHLFICDHQSYRLLTWDGRAPFHWEDPDGMVTTSSHEPAAVIRWRSGWWKNLCRQRLPLDVGAQRLRQVNPQKPAYGVTMDREDARTVSQIELELGQSGFVVTYRAREPDGPGFEDPVTVRYPA